MTIDTGFVSRYELRIKLARDVVEKHTSLDEKSANELAIALLHAIDTVPEKTR